MHRLLIAVTLVLLTCPAASSAEHYTSVTIPEGTLIKMFIVGDVNTQGTHMGDTFQAQAASDVVVNGVVVVRKGAEGQGTVGDAKRAGGSVTNPLMLTFDWVYAADGSKIRLSANDGKQAASARKIAASSTVSPSTLAAFGLAGMFGIVSASTKENVSIQVPAEGDH